MSASADYGVSIVESFAPPANWLPGQEVNKDTYAVNTGSVAAYVRNDVSGVLTITKEAPVAVRWGVVGSTTNPSGIATALVDPSAPTDQTKDTAFDANNKTGKNFDSFITLDEDEVFSIEAGSYLAYKPAVSQQELGKQVVLYTPNASAAAPTTSYVAKENFTTTIGGNPKTFNKNDEISDSDYANIPEADKIKVAIVNVSAAKTDFTPDVEGLYVFRRSVIVNNNATEQFEYNCYYFKDGRYYKMTDLAVTQDDSVTPNLDKELDVAGDNNDMDGQLANAEAKFLVDETKVYYEPDKYEYDAENNRLVATYFTDGSAYDTYETKAKALDEAEHELAEYRTALDKALMDAAASDANVAFYTNRIAQLQAELAKVNARIAELVGTGDYDNPSNNSIVKNLKNEDARLSTTGTGVIDSAKKAANDSLETLYGKKPSSTDPVATTELDPTNANFGKVTYGTLTPAGKLPETVATLQDDATVAEANKSLYRKYLEAKEAVDTAYNTTYGHDLFTAYVNELKNDTTIGALLPSNPTYQDVLNKVPYITLSTQIAFASGSDYHNINELTAKLIKAKADYEKELTNYKTQLNEVKTNTNRLGSGDITTTTNDNTDIIAGVPITYSGSTVNDGASGVRGDLAAAKAEYTDLASKKSALDTAIAQATQAAVDAEKAPDGTDAGDTATAAWETYRQKAAAYDTALAEYNAAKKNYEDNRELKVYINLSDNVVTSATGLVDRWQIWDSVADDSNDDTTLGIQLNNVYNEDGTVQAVGNDDGTTKKDTAVFYYTGILEPSETSSKLIDSVTLDSGVNQNMYKYFDYDLNVALKSAQIAYTGNGDETISTVPADTELGKQFGATASLTNNKSLDTAVNWATT